MGRGQPPRVGVLWRGDRWDRAPTARVIERLGPLLDALRALPVVVDHVVFADDAIDQVREQLLRLDGVLVWVNPIQDGQNRGRLDALLQEVAAEGVWVSAHPDVIAKLGTKEVLHRARDLVWGSDVELYRDLDDLAARLPARMSTYRRLVVKQGRGNGGDGVWMVKLRDPEDGAGEGAAVIVRDARVTDGASESMSLAEFVTRCGQNFDWSGCLIDQPFQERLSEGMLRCYFSGDRVVGFCRQWPRRGLLDPDEAVANRAAARESIMEPVEAPAYQDVRQRAEAEWLPGLLSVLDLDGRLLPALWDADLLFGPRTSSSTDTYVLCEVNASAVWPFPPTAAPTIAAAVMRHFGH